MDTNTITQVLDMPVKEVARRMTPVHPKARRQLARQTDMTYRGPHNIVSDEEEPFRLLGVADWVWWVAAGLSAVCWASSIIQGL